VLFLGAAFHRFGPLTNEDLHAHPLASHGLLRDSTFAGIYGNGEIAAREAFSLRG
jgi:hypothetical protein